MKTTKNDGMNRWARLAPDMADVIAMAGLASLGYGLWLMWPALAYVVVGTILLLLGILGALRNGR